MRTAVNRYQHFKILKGGHHDLVLQSRGPRQFGEMGKYSWQRVDKDVTTGKKVKGENLIHLVIFLAPMVRRRLISDER
jgi:hypothetical protein